MFPSSLHNCVLSYHLCSSLNIHYELDFTSFFFVSWWIIVLVSNANCGMLIYCIWWMSSDSRGKAMGIGFSWWLTHNFSLERKKGYMKGGLQSIIPLGLPFCIVFHLKSFLFSSSCYLYILLLPFFFLHIIFLHFTIWTSSTLILTPSNTFHLSPTLLASSNLSYT